MIGFGFSVFTQAILGAGGFAKGSSLALDFTSGNRTLDPRITFSRTTNATVTGSNGLIQSAPMNLLTFSEQFDNAAWTKSSSSVVANTTAAPDGTLTADTLTAAAANGFVYQVFSAAAATYTFSVWIKSVSVGITLELNLHTNTGASSVGAAIVTTTGSWQRVSVTGTFTSASASAWATIGGNASFSTGETLYIWGAQLELGSTATTYNPTTVKNLLGYTEHFDNAAWTKSNASISATKVDDIYGQPFAQKLVASTASSTHFTSGDATVVSGTKYTASIYVKAAEYSTAIIGFLASTGFSTTTSVLVNLAEGTVSAGTGTPLSSAIANVGNGWYRVSVVLAATASGTGSIYIAAVNGTTYADRTVAGDGTSGIYIFGAQLSDSASVDPYVYNPVAAPASTAYYGPRFDYDPVTLAPKGLLIEEQRTNLLVRSEELDNASWTKAESSVSANAAVSPGGSVTADKLIASTVATTHLTTQSPTVVSGTTYTFSVHLKAAEYGAALVGFVGSSGFGTTSSIVVNLATGAISAGTGTLLSSSAVSTGNGWWRVAVSLAASASAAGSVYVAVINGTTFADRLNAGDGTSGIYVWGAQLEAGAFATSYIPTVASQVTRAADNASMIGANFSSWYNATEGTLYADVVIGQDNDGSRFFANIDDGTNSNAIDIRSGSITTIGGIVSSGGTQQANMASTAPAIGATAKNAVAYKINDFAFCCNNQAVVVDTLGSVPVTPTKFSIGSYNGGAGNFVNSTIKRIAYYPRRLSNSELQGITS